MLDAFFARIEEAKASLGFKEREECFFRGQSNSSWPLSPSLFRHFQNVGLALDQWRRVEATLFFEFQARARELHGRQISGWDTLFFMRHHGVATRILDWTEVLGVALYFAVSGGNHGTPCLWLLNPYALNEHPECAECRDLVAPQYLTDAQGDQQDYDWYLHGSFPPFGWRRPQALYPLQLSSRLQAQGGYFTIHGEDTLPLDRIAPEVLVKIDIEPELVPKINDYLNTAGITTSLLFPDLDGLAKRLHEKYGILQSTQAAIYGK
jgi:hypothetical protein